MIRGQSEDAGSAAVELGHGGEDVVELADRHDVRHPPAELHLDLENLDPDLLRISFPNWQILKFVWSFSSEIQK